MIIWGGSSGTGTNALIGLNTGGRYNPSTDTWSSISTTNTPGVRIPEDAVWTGSDMIIWGGFSLNAPGLVWNTGGRYNPLTDTWTATSVTNAPSARQLFSTVWTGSEMIVWGGCCFETNTGGRYNLPDERSLDSD
jgi:N-acetylneuraminic acid mutarotase